MNKIVYTFLIFLCASRVFSQNDSLKYLHHNTYESFVQFLMDSTSEINSEVERLIYIRKKAANLIDMGVGTKDVSLLSNKWADFNSKQYYDLFRSNAATVKCGGSALFLKNLYADLGYKSYTYDMGCPGAYSHQVTVVKSKDKDIYYVQDAFYNVSFYERKSKEYLNFRKMIHLLTVKKSNRIQVRYDEYEHGFSWDTTGLNKVLLSRGIDTDNKRALSKVTMNRKKFIKASQKHNNRAEVCLTENELPKKIIYLYLIPLENNPKKIIQLITEAKKETFEE